MKTAIAKLLGPILRRGHGLTTELQCLPDAHIALPETILRDLVLHNTVLANTLTDVMNAIQKTTPLAGVMVMAHRRLIAAGLMQGDAPPELVPEECEHARVYPCGDHLHCFDCDEQLPEDAKAEAIAFPRALEEDKN